MRFGQLPRSSSPAQASGGRARFGKSAFENRHYALFGLMSIYGIELLDDNVAECRENLLEIFAATHRRESR